MIFVVQGLLKRQLVAVVEPNSIAQEDVLLGLVVDDGLDDVAGMMLVDEVDWVCLLEELDNGIEDKRRLYQLNDYSLIHLQEPTYLTISF